MKHNTAVWPLYIAYDFHYPTQSIGYIFIILYHHDHYIMFQRQEDVFYDLFLSVQQVISRATGPNISLFKISERGNKSCKQWRQSTIASVFTLRLSIGVLIVGSQRLFYMYWKLLCGGVRGVGGVCTFQSVFYFIFSSTASAKLPLALSTCSKCWITVQCECSLY